MCKPNNIVITGKPTPAVQWLHNGKAMASGEAGVKISQKDDIHTLEIDSVGQVHDGDYMVRAENASGSVQTSANLSVQVSKL